MTSESLNFKNKLTAYEGQVLYGRVQETYIGGKLVYQGGFEGLKPVGKLL